MAVHAAAAAIRIRSIYRCRQSMAWAHHRVLLFLCTPKATSRANDFAISFPPLTCRLLERMAPKFFNPADFSGLSGPGAVPALDLVGICMVFACRLPARPACLGATCG